MPSPSGRASKRRRAITARETRRDDKLLPSQICGPAIGAQDPVRAAFIILILQESISWNPSVLGGRWAGRLRLGQLRTPSSAQQMEIPAVRIVERGDGHIHVQLSTKPRPKAEQARPVEVDDAEEELERRRRAAFLSRRKRTYATPGPARVVDKRSARTAGRFAAAPARRVDQRVAPPKHFRVDSACPERWAQFVHVWPPKRDRESDWWHKGYEAQLWGSEKHKEARAPRRTPIPDNVLY